MKNEECIEILYDIQTDIVYGLLNEEKEAIDMAIQALEQQPKMGKWRRPYKFSAIYECSVCHKQIPITDGFYEFYYCPNCGAKMDADMREVQDGE